MLTHEGNANGYVNGIAAVNILDLNQTKNELADPVTINNFRNDVDCNNVINILDLNAEKSNLGAAKPVCP